MEVNDCCKFIYNLRKSKGMTQKNLAERVCSVRQLIRIEKGLCHPTLYTFEKLLTKLGVDISKYLYNFVNEGEQMAYYETLEIWDCIFEQEYELAESKFLSFKQKSYFNMNDTFIKQFSLLCESIFLCKIYNDPKSALKAAYDAIYTTIPQFDLECIDNHYLILEEFVIVNNIALCHIALENTTLGIDILKRLVKLLLKKQLPKEIRNRLLSTICYNLSKCLGLQESYSEAISICDKGIEACRSAKTTKSLGELFYNKACCLHFLNDKNEAKSFFRLSYNTLLIAGNSKKAEIIKKNAMEKYDVLVTD